MLLALMMVLSLAACGGNPTPQTAENTESSDPAGESAPSEDTQTAQESEPQQTEEPSETSAPEGSSEPEDPYVMQMVEITMDNWQDYFEIITYDTTSTFSNNGKEEQISMLNWGLALKEEYSQQFRANGVYEYPEDAFGGSERIMMMLGSGLASIENAGSIRAKVRVTCNTSRLWSNDPTDEYACEITEMDYLIFLINDLPQVRKSFGEYAHEFPHRFDTEEERAQLEDAIQVEMFDISGTIPVWVEK